MRPASPPVPRPALALALLLGLPAFLAPLPAPLRALQAPAAPTAESAPSQGSATADPAGAWKGAIDLPGGQLEVRVELSKGAEGWTGTIDIPQQGAHGLTLTPVEVDGAHIRFTIPGVPGEPTFDGTVEGDKLGGAFTQGPAHLTFHLERTDQPAPELKRPQNPQPPFPYRSEEVTVDRDFVHLAGTLTLPAGKGPFPGIVLLTGSGPQDRDESLMGHKPFWVLADHLSRHGIVVLRLDDRGVGGSTGSLATATLEDLAGDARAAVRFLAARPEVADDRVGLLGHSEGGVVAPLAAADADPPEDGAAAEPEARPAFVVMLAGPGLPGSQVLETQLGRLLRVQGVPESLGPAADAMIAQAIRVLLDHGGEPDLEETLEQGMLSTAKEQGADRPEAEQAALRRLAGALATQLTPLGAPAFHELLVHDPAPVLRRVHVPVLALDGGLDLQVAAGPNLAAIHAALETAGNGDVTTRQLPGLNHLFQHAQTGNPMEYGQIEETISPEVLELVTGWILERFGSPDPG